MSVSIQADEVVARVGAELDDAMARLFPEDLGKVHEDAAELQDHEYDGQLRTVRVAGDGYLQIVDAESLMDFARQTDTVPRLVCQPGHYVVNGTPLLHAFTAERVPEDMQQRLQAAFVLGNQRTAAQDIEFAILQLVEIAARALSPGLNDPCTAIACIDRLGSAFCRQAQRRFPGPYRYDDADRLRIIATPRTFSGLADVAFNPLRNYARAHVEVTVRLLESIAVIASVATRRADRATLERHADMIARRAAEAMPEEADRRAVNVRLHAVRQALAGLTGHQGRLP